MTNARDFHMASIRADRARRERDEVVHECPIGAFPLTPCCGKSPFDLPRDSKIAAPGHEHMVTCPQIVERPTATPVTDRTSATDAEFKAEVLDRFREATAEEYVPWGSDADSDGAA